MRNLPDFPARSRDGRDVGGVLPRGQAGIDRGAVAVRDDALRHSTAGAPHQRDALVIGGQAA